MKPLRRVEWAVMLSIAFLSWKLNAQWLPQNTDTRSTLWSISFIDPRSGWIVYSDSVFRTTNGGAMWSKASVGIPSILTGVSFVDNEYGWATGTSVIRTTNSGQTWKQQLHVSTFYQGIFFLDRRFGWAFGARGSVPGSGLVQRTTDSGNTWTEHSTGPRASEILSGFFVDSLTGWAVGRNVVLCTTNGGIAWTEQDSMFVRSLGVPVRSVFFLNKNLGWICGGINDTGFLGKTTDGGATWEHTIIPAPGIPLERLNWIYFINERVGWAVGRPFVSPLAGIIKTTDGGETWTRQLEGVPSNAGQLLSVSFVDSVRGWAVGENGTILATTNGGATFVQTADEMPQEFRLQQNFPNPFNPSTRIRFELSSVSRVSLSVFDLLGRCIEVIVDEEMQAGTHEAEFNSWNLASGSYFYRLTAIATNSAKQLSATKVMTILK